MWLCIDSYLGVRSPTVTKRLGVPHSIEIRRDPGWTILDLMCFSRRLYCTEVKQDGSNRFCGSSTSTLHREEASSSTRFSGMHSCPMAEPACLQFKDEVLIFMDSLEACLAGCPCADSFAQRSRWIIAEYNKLETLRAQATAQLLEAKDEVSSKDDTIGLLRKMNSILLSKMDKLLKQLTEERRVNSSLRAEITRGEDIILELKRHPCAESTVAWHGQVQTFI